MSTQSNKSYISHYRQLTDIFLSTTEGYLGAKAQYTALDLGNTLADADFTGEGITRAEFIAAVASIDAILALLATGHNTNLYKLKH